MQLEDFEKLLRQSAENERELPFDDEAWQQLAGHLNAIAPQYSAAQPRRRRWLVALPWLILLPLLAWNFWLQAQLLALKNQVATQQKIFTEAIDATRDTVFLQKNIHQRDTIWLVSRAQLLPSGKDFSSENFTSNFSTNWSRQTAAAASFQLEKTLTSTNFPAAQSFQPPENQNFKSAVADSLAQILISKNAAADLLAVLSPAPVETARDVFLKQPASYFWASPTKKIRPRPALTAQFWGGGSSVVGSLENGWQGLESGVQLGIGRGGAGWSVVLGLERRWGWFLPQDGSLHGVLPAGHPADPNDELHHAHAAFRWFSLAPGIQKNWAGVGRASFFAAAGAEFDFLRKANFNYEYVSALDPQMEYFDRFSGAAAGWEISRFWLQVGLRRAWSKGFFGQISLGGRAGFRASDFFPDQRFLPVLRLGLGKKI